MELKKIKFTQMAKLDLEMAVYSSADHFWERYQGGTWSFSSKGKFWYPHEQRVELCNPVNYFEGILSSQTAGIALSMFAANQLCWKFHNDGFTKKSEYWGEYYYYLNDYLMSKFSDEDISKVKLFLD